MLFHTWPFLVFMLVVLPVFFALRRTKLWIPWLMAASYFFYGCCNPWYLMIVFGVLVLLMALGSLLGNRKIWLLISLFNNLAILLFFKYARFVVENLNAVLEWAGAAGRLADPSTLMPYGFAYVLPVGISFF